MMLTVSVDATLIPTVSVDQMRAVDRLMTEEMEISLLQMMENAGRALAAQARQLLGGDARGRRIVVLAGRGGNGGGGLAAARRLSIWGADVSVILGQEAEEMQGVPAHQLAILHHMGVPVHGPGWAASGESGLRSADLILDALIGYSLHAAPREPVATLIRAANAAGPPLLALDIPSGLDGNSGAATDPTIRATATLMLALPKAGLVQPAARTWVGALYVADISVPTEVYSRLGLRVGPLFAWADIVPVMPRDDAEEGSPVPSTKPIALGGLPAPRGSGQGAVANTLLRQRRSLSRRSASCSRTVTLVPQRLMLL